MSTQTYPDGYFGKEGKHKPSKTVSAERYSNLNRHKQPLMHFILSLPPGAVVLDAGCGKGDALYMMQALRPDVTLFGVDISDVSELMPEGTTFTQGSVEDLQTLYPAETFDAVLCLHVIEHLFSPLPMMAGIRHVLKSGGKVYIETPNWTRLFVPFSFLFFWNDYTHVHPHTPFSLRMLSLHYNFSVDSIRTISSCWWYIPGKIKKLLPWNRKARASATVHHEVEGAAAGYVQAHRANSLFARVAGFLLNPLLRDLMIAIATKE